MPFDLTVPPRALFGGCASMILTWLTQRSGGSICSPAWYVMLAAGVALIAIPFRKTRGQ